MGKGLREVGAQESPKRIRDGGEGGGPVKGGPLHGHGAGDQQKSFQPRLSLKGLVGEHAVEAKGDAKTANAVHHEEKAEIHPVHPLIPEEKDGTDDAENRKPNEGQENEFGEGSSCVGVSDGCAQAVSFAYIP